MTKDTTSDAPTALAPDEEYRIGPGRPPKKYQFKPGQSGNPKGAKRKEPPIAPDLKRLLEQALNKPVTLKQGDRERIVSMFAAGVEQLVAQFAKGDRHARRELIPLAEKLGIDLVTGGPKTVEQALPANHQEILDDYVRRQYDKAVRPAPVFAPAELLDDDPEDRT
jgi:hypothetical protein